MVKKAVLIYAYQDDDYDYGEIWVILPEDSYQYKKAMTYISLVGLPETVLAESDDYEFTSVYLVSEQIIDTLKKSYNLTSEVIEF